MSDIKKLTSLLAGPLDAIAPGVGTAASTALTLLETLAPSDYKPVKYNENYNQGGPIDPDPENPYKKKVKRAEAQQQFWGGVNWRDNIMDLSKGKETNDRYIQAARETGMWRDLQETRDNTNNVRAKRQAMEKITKPVNQLLDSISGNNNFNKGGTIDKQLSSQDIKIQGKNGIDTNRRNVVGQQVNLTKGETVSMTSDGAEVYSDAPNMKHPLVDKTFAEVAEGTQKSTGKAEKKLQKFPNDRISRNTVAVNKQIMSTNAARQDQERTKVESAQVMKALNSLNKYLGGKVKGYYLGTQDPLIPIPTASAMSNDRLNNIQSTSYPSLANRALPAEFTNTTPAPSHLNTADNMQGMLNTISPGTEKDSQLKNTVGDYIYAGAKTIETLGRVAKAFDAPEQFATDRYNVDRIKLSAQDQLDANNRSYRSAVASSASGSANVDRVTANSLFAQKIIGDNTARRDLQNRQADIDLRVNQHNASQKAVVDQINSQTQGLKNQTVDAALSSIGTLGNVYMDLYNSRVENKITLDTLNSMSRYYKVDVDKLVGMMKNSPSDFDEMLVKFNSENR